jgi:hypothetical protein
MVLGRMNRRTATDEAGCVSGQCVPQPARRRRRWQDRRAEQAQHDVNIIGVTRHAPQFDVAGRPALRRPDVGAGIQPWQDRFQSGEHHFEL